MATIDNFLDKISNEVTEFSDTIKKDLEATLDEAADQILEYIRSNAPRSGKRGAMADEFVKEDRGTGIHKTIIIHAKSKGRLIHLIEFGFTHRNGKYIAPRPFMRPAYDAFTPKMLEKIRSIIRGQ